MATPVEITVDPIQVALRRLEDFLGTTVYRTLVTSVEVQDFLLDLHRILEPIPHA